MRDELLSKINSPEDLKALPEKDVPALCEEIRAFLVENTLRAGGHLASNLGVTELTVAIHRVFSSPKDHVIFDVGHQAYVHKMLTGRMGRFDELRKPGGLSGFTLRRESEHDPFGAGHSSTSVSAALGFAEADALEGRKDYTVCVIGDGAYTGGMVHEALNNIKPDLRLIIILNENRMSISKNKGAFSSYLARVRISEGYRRWKDGTDSVLHHIPLIGKPLFRFLRFLKERLKRLLYSANYFEDLGLYYVGPVNGNDFHAIEHALTEAKKTGKSVLVHTYTKKGKGYEPAEHNPDAFHSVYPGASKGPTFHAAFADELTALAEKDEKILAVTAAMGVGTGLSDFGKKFPKRYFDVGIAEEHALTFSAGLAASGEKPFVAIYSTFLQRGYDNLLHDIALQNLPVRVMIDRAGLAPSDGATHHGIFDVAFLSEIPGFTIYAPATIGSLRAAVCRAASADSPVAIRYPNSPEDARVAEEFYPEGDYSAFGVRVNFDPKIPPEYLFITYGSFVSRVLSATDLLAARGKTCGVILLEELKPYQKIAKEVLPLLAGVKKIVFAEEGIRAGGAGMNLFDALLSEGFDKTASFEIAAIDDNFASPEAPCDLYDYVGLSPEKLAGRFDRS